MSINVVVTKELVFPQVEASTKEEVISLLADALEKQGFVKDTYKDAILAREKEYPTGLPSTSPMVAIPHADNNHVNTTSIAVAEPHGQIEMLQRIIGCSQNDEAKNKLVHSVDKEKILEVIQESILKEE